MITRYKMQVDDILHSESLNCYPAENQAAKIFAKWLKKHPEHSPDDVDMRIDSYEREEDYYDVACQDSFFGKRLRGCFIHQRSQHIA